MTNKNKIHHGCLNCGGTSEILSLETKLYYDFGGWKIEKDGKTYYQIHDFVKPFDNAKTLKEIEAEARLDPDHDWKAVFNLALRGGQYQRQGDDKWVLIESNQGFA